MDIIDRIYNNKYGDLVLDFFKRSKVSGKITKSIEYNHYIYRYEYDKELLKFKGIIKKDKKTYEIEIKLSDDELKIKFGEYSFTYYYKKDKFYDIYNQVKNGILPISDPKEFENIGSTEISVNCDTFKQIIERLFKKAKIVCDTEKTAYDYNYSYSWE